MFGEACLKEIAGYDVATDLIKREAGGRHRHRHH